MASPPTPRTTQALVAGIIEVTPGVDLTPFIAIGNQMTTDNCTYPARGGYQVPYTDGFVGSKMELIERWLSAHFYAIFDTQLTFARAGTVGVGYQHKINYGLMNTQWGQQAMMLDQYAGLARVNNSAIVKKKVRVDIMWLGRRCRWESSYGFGGPFADLTICQ
jgi:hypothetical protein